MRLIEATFDLDGDLYRVSRDDSRKTILAFRVAKLSGARAGTTYTCRRFASGEQRCDCMDASCRKRVCKHLAALHQLGVLPASGEVDDAEAPRALVEIPW